MASYEDIRSKFDDVAFINRVDVAVMVAVELIRNDEDDGTGDGSGFEAGAANHDLRKTWTAVALDNFMRTTKQIWALVLAQHRSSTIAQIDQATDSTLQTAVNKAVDLMAGV